MFFKREIVGSTLECMNDGHATLWLCFDLLLCSKIMKNHGEKSSGSIRVKCWCSLKKTKIESNQQMHCCDALGASLSYLVSFSLPKLEDEFRPI